MKIRIDKVDWEVADDGSACSVQRLWQCEPFYLPEKYKQYRRFHFEPSKWCISIQFWWFGIVIGWGEALVIRTAPDFTKENEN